MSAAAAAAAAATAAVKEHLGPGEQTSAGGNKKDVKDIDLDHGTGLKSKHVLDKDGNEVKKDYIPDDEDQLEALSQG